MSTQIQYRRGTQAQNDGFTGVLAEITVDTTNNTLRVHNGVTQGGFALVGATATQTLTNKTLTSPTITTATFSGTQTGSANLNLTGFVSASGNVTGNYLLGNAYFVTGLSPTRIYNGTSEVNISASNGNANITIGGTSNVFVAATTGVFVDGLTSVTGNIIGGNLNTAGAVAATSSVTGGGITLNGNTISSTGSTLTIDPAAAGTTGTVVIAGNLSVQGTTTTYDSTTVTINDLVFTVANNAATSAAANGGGIEVGPAGSPYATWTYDQPNSRWTTSLGINSGGNANVGNLGAATVVATTLTGTLSTAAQPNITSVGTLTSLAVSGNLSSLTASGNTNTTQVATTAFVVGQAGGATPGAVGSAAVGTSLRYAREDHTHSGVTSVNGSTGAVTGIATTGATLAQFASTTSAQLAGVISDETGSGSLVFATSPTLTTPNIGAATGTSLNISTGTLTCGSIVNANANGVGNIGSSTTYFNTVFAKATSAQYADVAEKYQADNNYPVGTVLVFGGDYEVTMSTESCDTRIAGTVSENPAYIMNGNLQGDNVAVVALLGRVPCRVIGNIRKGDVLISSHIPGTATSLKNTTWAPGCVIGKALEDYNSQDPGVIEIVVGRF